MTTICFHRTTVVAMAIFTFGSEVVAMAVMFFWCCCGCYGDHVVCCSVDSVFHGCVELFCCRAALLLLLGVAGMPLS